MHYSASDDTCDSESLAHTFDVSANGAEDSPGGFELHYQAQVCADRQVRALEALLRWKHPLYGYVPPIEFIGQFERTGTIHLAGMWALREAGRQMFKWKTHRQLRKAAVSLNVSAVQLQEPSFAKTFVNRVQSDQIDASRLVMEITESAPLPCMSLVHDQLSQIREAGVRVSLDDVGCGYSALSYLQRLPIDQIKLDKGFTSDIDRSNKDRTIVEYLVAMAKDLGVEVVAEGVETRAQFETLKEIGCDLFQGYFFDKPKPARAWQ